MTEYFETSSKIVRRGRGKAQKSLDLIEAMYAAAETAQPITGRGVGYKLFTQGLIPSMGRADMQRVYRLLKEARERGDIPWEWIVDETRAIERVPTWSDPAEYASCVAQSYRRDFWDHQPHRVQVWSEKGTVRGVLKPVLDHYAVGFNPVHGFTSATDAHGIAEDDDGRDLIVLYVGDFDPSGMCMSERDLPSRFVKYDGDHIKLKRIALTPQQVRDLPPFPATDKRKDPRFAWFVKNYGERCWELDAMDPNDLRACVKREIKKLIEPVAWKRCEEINTAEQRIVANCSRPMGRAMTGRERLPNRRGCESFAFQCAGLPYIASISRFPNGDLSEIFISNHKSGSDADTAARDSAVVCSIALQYGVPLDVIRKALMRDSRGVASSPLGAALDLIAESVP